MARRTIWEIEVSHPGLSKYRHIRGSDRHVVEQKADTQMRIWDEMWERKQEQDQRRLEKEGRAQEKLQKQEIATDRTNRAETVLAGLAGTLAHTLGIDDAVDWDALVDESDYPEPKPVYPTLPASPDEPKLNQISPKIGFFASLVPGLTRRRSM